MLDLGNAHERASLSIVWALGGKIVTRKEQQVGVELEVGLFKARKGLWNIADRWKTEERYLKKSET